MGCDVVIWKPPSFPLPSLTRTPPLPPSQFEGQPRLPTEAEDGGEAPGDEANRPVPGSVLALKQQYPVRV